MHSEIELVQKQIFELYQRQRAYLASKPAAYVEELQHRAEDALKSDKYSERVAGEINRTACVLVRGKGGR